MTDDGKLRKILCGVVNKGKQVVVLSSGGCFIARKIGRKGRNSVGGWVEDEVTVVCGLNSNRTNSYLFQFVSIALRSPRNGMVRVGVLLICARNKLGRLSLPREKGTPQLPEKKDTKPKQARE